MEQSRGIMNKKKYRKAKKKWLKKHFKYFCIVDNSGNYIQRTVEMKRYRVGNNIYKKENKKIKIDNDMSPAKKSLFLSLYNSDLDNAVFYAIRVFLRNVDKNLKFSFVGDEPIYSVKKKFNKEKLECKKENKRLAELKKIEETNDEFF